MPAAFDGCPAFGPAFAVVVDLRENTDVRGLGSVVRCSAAGPPSSRTAVRGRTLLFLPSPARKKIKGIEDTHSYCITAPMRPWVCGSCEGEGNVSLFHASASRFGDGEWVPFRRLTWEGGGGDTASLYWSARDTNASFGRAQVPGTSDPTFVIAGTNLIGSEAVDGRFGTLNLPNGD